MTAPNRTRNIQLNFRVDERERALIEEKMRRAGTVNREAYLRKMAMDGYIVRLDLPELKEMIALLRRTGNNVNQIARRMNETGRVYEADIADVQERQERLWAGMNELLSKLSAFR